MDLFHFQEEGPGSVFCHKKGWKLFTELIDYMNLHYETRTKGGKGPNFTVNDPKEYIVSLNWVSNWINVYFFTNE